MQRDQLHNLALHEACPVCGGEDLREVRSAQISSAAEVSFSYRFSREHNRTFRVVRCRNCTHVFCSPVPSNLTVGYEDVVDEEYLNHADANRLTGLAALRVLRTLGARGPVLDVGCATGDFLDAARSSGYDAEGVEISRWSARMARDRGFVVYDDLARLEKERPRHYGLITLWAVIEHLDGPLDEMRSIAQLLAPGGLVAIWTGDVRSVPSLVFGRHWWYWQGQHIQYFSHRSLRMLAERCGLREVRTSVYPYVLTQSRLMNSLRRYAIPVRALNWLSKPLFAVRPAWYVRIPGEMLFVARSDK